MIPPFQIHQPTAAQPTAYDLTAAQAAVKLVLDEIANTRRPQVGSEILRSNGADVEIGLVAGQENLVEHGLGRAVAGWRIVDITSPALVWRIASPATSGYSATKYHALGCSADVTVKLEVW